MAPHTKYFVSELVAEVGSLPSLATQVVSLASSPDCDLQALTRLILSDNVLAMRFLALANSAAFAHGQEIKDLRGALVRLGTRRVRNVALLMGMHDMSPRASRDLPLDPAAYWKHCLAVASCAHGLAKLQSTQDREDAWLVGILHGLGINALLERTGADFGRALAEARQQQSSLAAAELRTLGFHHGELGARILRTWQLPTVFAEAVEFQVEDFAQAEVSPAARELIRILRAAIALARAIGYGVCGDCDPTPDLRDLTSELKLASADLAALAEQVDSEVRELSHLIGLTASDDLFSRALADSREEVARVGLAGLDDTLIREDFENQMAAAREIQNHILPQMLPQVPGFSLAAFNQPSRQISGDTYDFLTMKDGAQGLVIADVAGKGMPAALLASTLQASLRALSQVFADPGLLLAAANQALCASTDDERFATLFLGVLEPDGTGMRYASAGHNPPLLRRASGEELWLKPDGTPLGMLPQASYPVQRVTLYPGDVLVGYTDGITEAANAQAEEFGTSGLARVLAAVWGDSPDRISAAIMAAVATHLTGNHLPEAGGATSRSESRPTNDDLTLLVLKKHD